MLKAKSQADDAVRGVSHDIGRRRRPTSHAADRVGGGIGELHPGEVIGVLVAVVETIVRETCGPDEAEIQDTIDAVCYALKSYSARQAA